MQAEYSLYHGQFYTEDATDQVCNRGGGGGEVLVLPEVVVEYNDEENTWL